MRSPRSLGIVAAALLLPVGAAAQQPQPHDHPATPESAQPTDMMQNMAARMQAMHEMMQQMHEMMMGMHGGQGDTSGVGMMHGPQGRGMQGGGTQGGRGMGMGAASDPSCLMAASDTRVSALLAGSVGPLALSADQWSELLGILWAAETNALAKLTPEQHARLEASRAACAQPTPVGPRTH
jgi:hypothetical protein